jgi:hypothetical protein
MTAERPDPGGTPSPGPDNLTGADEQEQERGRAVKPGN